MPEENQIIAIMPSYNEEESLPMTLGDLKRERPDIDILVIDDGSKDNTANVARSLGCPVVSLPVNLGIGGAVQTGLMYAVEHGYQYGIQFDADGQHIAGEIKKILDAVENGVADVAIGSRFLSEGGFRSSVARRMGIRIFQYVISTAIRQKITDSTSGFRAYNLKAMRFLALDYPCDYPEVEAVVVLAKNRFIIKEVPVLMRERQGGVSSINRLQSIYYMIKVLLTIFMSIARGATIKTEEEGQ